MDFHDFLKSVYPAQPRGPEDLLLVDQLFLIRHSDPLQLARIPFLRDMEERLAAMPAKELVFHPWALDKFATRESAVKAIFNVTDEMVLARRPREADSILIHYIADTSRRLLAREVARICVMKSPMPSVVLQALLDEYNEDEVRLMAILVLSDRSQSVVGIPDQTIKFLFSLMASKGKSRDVGKQYVSALARSALYRDQDILTLVSDDKLQHVQTIEDVRLRDLDARVYVSLLDDTPEMRDYAASKICHLGKPVYSSRDLALGSPFYLERVAKHHLVASDLRMKALQAMMQHGVASMNFIFGLGMSMFKGVPGDPFADLVSQAIGSEYMKMYSGVHKELNM